MSGTKIVVVAGPSQGPCVAIQRALAAMRHPPPILVLTRDGNDLGPLGKLAPMDHGIVLRGLIEVNGHATPTTERLDKGVSE